MLRNAPSVGTMRYVQRDLNSEFHEARARAVILEVLSDPAGGGMCHYPSGNPSPRACALADEIVRLLSERGF